MLVVKLNKLIIDKMYGSYRYEVLFNDDITFIYGMNGCGKTTVLNITEAIITGALYHLFEYDFSQIQLILRRAFYTIRLTLHFCQQRGSPQAADG